MKHFITSRKNNLAYKEGKTSETKCNIYVVII